MVVASLQRVFKCTQTHISVDINHAGTGCRILVTLSGERKEYELPVHRTNCHQTQLQHSLLSIIDAIFIIVTIAIVTSTDSRLDHFSVLSRRLTITLPVLKSLPKTRT